MPLPSLRAGRTEASRKAKFYHDCHLAIGPRGRHGGRARCKLPATPPVAMREKGMY